MPVSLLALSLVCCIDLYVQERKRFGSIQLPKDDVQLSLNGQSNGDGEHTGDSVKEQQSAQDEGIPVEEERWWLRVRLRKAALVGVLILLDATACATLGWDGMSGAKSGFRIVEDILMVVFWVGSRLSPVQTNI